MGGFKINVLGWKDGSAGEPELNSQELCKNAQVLVCVCNLSAGEAQTWRPIQLTGQSFSLISELQANEDSILKEVDDILRVTHKVLVLSPYTRAPMCTHAPHI